VAKDMFEVGRHPILMKTLLDTASCTATASP
jgi:hypothetical protein